VVAGGASEPVTVVDAGLDAREADGAAVGRLAALFAELYDGSTDTKRVLEDAGLMVLAVNTNDSDGSAFRWFKVFALARGFSKVRPIFDVALREHPGIPALERAAADASLLGPDERTGHAAVVVEVATAMPVNLRRLLLGPERPLIDRVDDVGSIRSRLEWTLGQREGSQVLLLGDSGVGKTRLAEQAMRLADGLGMVALQAQCLDKHSEAHHPIKHALAQYRQDTPIADLLRAAGLPERMPVIESFLGVAPPGDARGHLGSEDVNAGITQLLVGLANGVGLCLVVEDLTDADKDTLSFLEYLSEVANASPVVTVLTVKDDLVAPDLRDRLRKWIAGGRAVQNVRALSSDETGELITLLRNGEAAPPGWVDDVYSQTGGNPFFVEQLVRLVAEAPGAGFDSVIPDGVDAVVRRRLDRIEDPNLLRFLKAAAVALELTNQLELVVHVGDMDIDTASELLDAAVGLRFLADDAQGSVRFSQSLVRRVLYDSIGKRVRATMNQRAAEWLEEHRLFASASHHYERADRPDDMVRTALKGAQEAELAGTYRTAVQLYRRARTAGNGVAIGLELARVHLIIGEWPEAEKVLGTLPDDSGQARLLRSELYFNRGEFDRALRELRLASQAPDVDRTDALLRRADIHLYLGRLSEARDLGAQALELAEDPTTRSRCLAVIGTSLYHMGDIDGADEKYLEEMNALPEEVGQRDRFAYTVALHNLALGREARGDWKGAVKLHEEALRLRTEVSAAREIGHSTHSLIRCQIGLEDFDTARAMLSDARTAAVALGDEVEQGKLDHTEGRIELLSGRDPAAAVRLFQQAVDRFRDLGVAYDLAHATFSLAGALDATGAVRRSLEEAASARAMLEKGTFGLLARLYPSSAYSYADRIEAGLLAYAAGDAVGLPWERLSADQIDGTRLPSLHATETWPAGATSDDTALTQLVAEHLVASGSPDVAGFMGRLEAAAPSLKGLGPSTTAAIDEFHTSGQLPTGDGNTNGALMRSLPIGWALPIDRVEDRRDWAVELSRATHPGAEAVAAACIGAALAAWAIEGAPPTLLLEIAREEAAAAVRTRAADARIEQMLTSIAAGDWQPDPGADELDPYETVARVLWCMRHESSMGDAILAGVRLGGDTDTVAALVGGLLGCRRPSTEVRAELPWIEQVDLPQADVLERVGRGLTHLRVQFSDG
jgi:ADP-ribosylglycohydrolase